MTTVNYKSTHHIYGIHKTSRIRYWFFLFLILLGIILFLPWTQNIRANGTVTTLRQEQRPQELNSIIPGKILKWYIREGEMVKAGDTLIQLAEIKDEYLDPELMNRTTEQLNAKRQAMDFYSNKVNATQNQVDALQTALILKQEQLRNKLDQLLLKVQSDSMDAIAANNEFSIASQQYTRQKAMYDSGLVSLTQLEQRNQLFQNALAKKISAENKLTNARQDLTITRIELNSVFQDYTEKISKAKGDQFIAQSQIAGSQGEIAKLQNQYSNYVVRSGLYYITAPQSGQVTKAKKAGIGEIIKEGEMLVEIVPEQMQYAVEIFVRPVDLPLVSKDQKVSLLFDGFPAIVFSGWPNASYGIFYGRVVAVENSLSSNGKFRVLIAEDTTVKRWPPQLRVGTGANGIALMKEVPVWYELWRNINGFPPDYYKPTLEQKKENEK